MKTTKEQAADLYRQHLPVWQIAERLGKTPPTIYAYLRALGVQTNRRRKLEPRPNA